ncbi:MAG: hypothetical protein JO281_11930 [Pseudonocardiales bacterium]|nr:hypothetical protein [Pseudonocardiales bacterium]
MASTADAEIYVSQPRLGTILGTRVLAEFGDDPHRYANAKARKNKARKNYAGNHSRSPASPTKRKSSWPAMCTTTGSSTPLDARPSPR